MTEIEIESATGTDIETKEEEIARRVEIGIELRIKSERGIGIRMGTRRRNDAVTHAGMKRPLHSAHDSPRTSVVSSKPSRSRSPPMDKSPPVVETKPAIDPAAAAGYAVTLHP